jgi:chemotaxis protein MotB
MSGHKRETPHPNHERWLVSYADFITLMFAFFVVMFASSQVDKRRVGNLAVAMQVAFQKLALFTPSSTQPNLKQTTEPFSNSQLVDTEIRTETLGQIAPSHPGELEPAEIVRQADLIWQQLQLALAEQIKKQQADVHFTHEGLVISLREVGFYDSGSADIKPEALSTVAKIAAILGQRGEAIRVEGHTDNVPIHNQRFDSNWDLSVARATGMLRLFISNYGFSPQRLSAAGYGEFHPVAPNDTPEERAKNRRVDIVVLAPTLSSAPPKQQAIASPSR